MEKFRDYLKGRIKNASLKHDQYKAREAASENEMMRLGYNSCAASCWDLKTELEDMLRVFDEQIAPNRNDAGFHGVLLG
jgi:hypothetical protein